MGASDVVRAPAKLNLTLEVLNRRDDGLHGLRSVMVPIDLHDDLRIETHGGGFAFSCDSAALQENNLVARAFHALALPSDEFKISLTKRIPTGAGMGGGSSDAAAVLLAAQRGAFGAIPAIDYLGTARSLGSDVPFFLVETAALVEGTGERVTALGPVPKWHCVIVKPPVAVSTAWAYAQIDAGARPSRPRSSSVSLQMAQALQRSDFEHAVALLQNDFYDVLVPSSPQIAAARDMLRAAGASSALMTGSGSCVFALVQTAQECSALADRLRPPAEYRVYTAAFWNGEAWRSAA
jgi:4-diphosphocytidyl-2-C-methyl-D-erythritol kinase